LKLCTSIEIAVFALSVVFSSLSFLSSPAMLASLDELIDPTNPKVGAAFIPGFLQPGFSRLPDHTPSVMWMGWRSDFCEAACFLQLPYGRLF
jgi:hypothetical protein